jgi:hypothetical protein
MVRNVILTGSHCTAFIVFDILNIVVPSATNYQTVQLVWVRIEAIGLSTKDYKIFYAILNSMCLTKLVP